MDRESIEASERWLPSIETAISQCQAVIVVLSRNCERSSFVARELSLAKQCAKPILPVARQQFNPTGYLCEFASIQYVDFARENFSSGMDKLSLDLNRKWIFPAQSIQNVSLSGILPGRWGIDMQDQGPQQMELFLSAEGKFDGHISRRGPSSAFGFTFPIEQRDYFPYSGVWRVYDTEIILDGHYPSSSYRLAFFVDELSYDDLKGYVAHNEQPCRWARR